MGMYNAIHWTIELFSYLDSAVVEPAVTRLFPLTIRGLWLPRHMSPKNRFMETGALKDCSGIDAVV